MTLLPAFQGGCDTKLIKGRMWALISKSTQIHCAAQKFEQFKPLLPVRPSLRTSSALTTVKLHIYLITLLKSPLQETVALCVSQKLQLQGRLSKNGLSPLSVLQRYKQRINLTYFVSLQQMFRWCFCIYFFHYYYSDRRRYAVK